MALNPKKIVETGPIVKARRSRGDSFVLAPRVKKRGNECFKEFPLI
jgi:hypothetical protein